MAFFQPASGAPKVEIAKREIREFQYAIAIATQYHRDITIVEYEKRGMTNAAADSYLTAQKALHNNPQKVPIGAGGYNVRTSEVTITSWET